MRRCDPGVCRAGGGLVIFDLVCASILIAAITAYGIIWTVRDRKREPLHRPAPRDPVYVQVYHRAFDWERD